MVGVDVLQTYNTPQLSRARLGFIARATPAYSGLVQGWEGHATSSATAVRREFKAQRALTDITINF